MIKPVQLLMDSEIGLPKEELQKKHQQIKPTSVQSPTKKNELFQLEELKRPNQWFIETISENQNTCCCGILPISQLRQREQVQTVEKLSLYFKVNEPEDIRNTYRKLQKQCKKIKCCSIGCFHSLGEITYEVCSTEQRQRQLFTAWAFAVIAVGLCIFPETLVYGCLRTIFSKCYQKCTRLGKLLQVYKKYQETRKKW